MATLIQKLLITLACGSAIGLGRCHAPEVEHPPAPPPDVAADADTGDEEQLQPPIEALPPEQEVIAMYGVAVEDEDLMVEPD